MAKRVSTAEAKAKLSELINEVSSGGERVIIERRGKPVAAVVSMKELSVIDEGDVLSARPAGALALVGLWKDIPDEEIDRFIEDVYRSRAESRGRPVELED